MPSFTGFPIACFLLTRGFWRCSHLSFLFATQLLADPLVERVADLRSQQVGVSYVVDVALVEV